MSSIISFRLCKRAMTGPQGNDEEDARWQGPHGNDEEDARWRGPHGNEEEDEFMLLQQASTTNLITFAINSDLL